MLDAFVRGLIAPVFDRPGLALARLGIATGAPGVAGLACAIAAAAAVAGRLKWVALALFLLSRVLDGLDGGVARAVGATDRGAFLSSLCGSAAWGLLPLAFALRAPATDALPAACLLAGFLADSFAVSTLAAALARRGRDAAPSPVGIAQATERTIAVTAMLAWPQGFAVIALALAGLAAMSALARAALGWAMLADDDPAVPL